MATDPKYWPSVREMFTGAFSIRRNPSARRQAKSADQREVIDLICSANQLLVDSIT